MNIFKIMRYMKKDIMILWYFISTLNNSVFIFFENVENEKIYYFRIVFISKPLQADKKIWIHNIVLCSTIHI